MHGNTNSMIQGLMHELIKKQKKVTQKHLEKLESLADRFNVPIKSQILKSKSVVNDIVTFAKSRKYDLNCNWFSW